MNERTSFVTPLLVLALGACGPGGVTGSLEGQAEDTRADDTTEGTQTEDTTGDTTEDTGPSCQPQPEVCARFLDCIAVLAPGQSEILEPLYGEEGSCWCAGEAAYDACVTTCSEQIDFARVEHPTEPACQLESCPIEELDPTQPYGPVVDGECPEIEGWGEQPFINPDGLPGSTCGYHCGIAHVCPSHSQADIPGRCVLMGPDNHLYCALWCYVDPNVQPGAQCPCGARCHPYGQDGEGHARGICLWE